ncbi:hypothetical protein KGV52_00910 [Candidatus Gracilibacteria bacterium]|nr:hypothetical protein [Candidatus Gracilibacteria bacterium]
MEIPGKNINFYDYIENPSLDELFKDAKLTPKESEILIQKINEAKTNASEETKDKLKWLVTYIAYEREGSKYTEAEKKQIFDFFHLATPPKPEESHLEPFVPELEETESHLEDFKPISENKKTFTADVIDTESNTNSFKNVPVDTNIPENPDIKVDVVEEDGTYGEDKIIQERLEKIQTKLKKYGNEDVERERKILEKEKKQKQKELENERKAKEIIDFRNELLGKGWEKSKFSMLSLVEDKDIVEVYKPTRLCSKN